MTAPLPPLPQEWIDYFTSSDPPCEIEEDTCFLTIREAKDFAKLAVREALERAIKRIRDPDGDGYPPMGSAKAAVAIRAMLKEYE
jgi:hypothetical protein